MNKSLLTKKGLTRVLTQGQVSEIMSKGSDSTGNVVITFKTDAEGLRLAKKYDRLARNPSIQMNVTFKKLTEV